MTRSVCLEGVWYRIIRGGIVTMKILMFALVALILGASAGVGTAWYDLVGTPSVFEPYRQPLVRQVGDGEEGTPRAVVVGGTTYDFGSGQRDARMKHTFEVRNEGDAPLTLMEGSSGCNCTWAALDTEELQPGESTHLTLEWVVETVGETFTETAELYTNDPEMPSIVLELRGNVVDRIKLEPPEVVLSDISASEGAEVEVWLYASGVSDLNIEGVRYSNSDLAPYFDLEFTRAEVPADQTPAPSLALRGTLVAKPGLPLGPINQTIHLETDDADVPELDLRVTGRVSSDISIVGSSIYRPQLNVLMLGQVEATEGAETTLRVLVKGPHRHDTTLEIGEVDPADVLQATLGEATSINQGAVYMTPLTISVPPGSRPVTRMGTDQGRYGRIVVETNHPDAKSVPVFVRFAVR